MFGNKKLLPYLFILLAILVILYFFVGHSKTNVKEGFVATNWSYKTIQNFLNYEQTTNPNMIFDVDVIQQQATEAEVNTLIQTGKWPWDEQTQKLYINAIQNSTILKTSPQAAMDQARGIYNQTIIREMMSWNAPEGQFLLNGAYTINTGNVNDGSGTYGVNSGLVNTTKNVVKCGIDTNNKVSLQLTGPTLSTPIGVDYRKLPNLIPGFRFIKSPCDPCTAVNSPPGYTCPFSLTSNDPSPVWMSLWGLQSSAGTTSNVDPSSFPVLKELQNELDNIFPNTGISKK